MQTRPIRKDRYGILPNLIVIGAMKCGTTSLHYYLGLHPEISMSREKELDFFISERNWVKGVEWYKSHFSGSTKICGETSPNYTVYPAFDGVPKRMHAIVPEAKLIYILRDPIDRIISHYVHMYADGLEYRPIDMLFRNVEDTSGYIRRSKYFMQLQQYLNYFPKSNILIVTLEDLSRHPRKTMQRIYRFLNVDDSFFSSHFLNIKHRLSQKRKKKRVGLFLKRISETNAAKIFSTDIRRNIGRVLYIPFSEKIQRPVLDESLRREIINYLREDIDSLRIFTGCGFTDWCV